MLCGVSFYVEMIEHLGGPKMTLEQAFDELMESPLATWCGGGMFTLYYEMPEGASSRIP